MTIMGSWRRERLFHVTALVSGLVFGMGLAISGMTNPAKVKAFLDISTVATGRWDPSLAVVMAAAVFVTMIAVRIAHRRRHPLAAPAFSRPGTRAIDGELVFGSILFGVGWGMAGLCPGPAVANIWSALPDILIFLVAMLAGSFLARLWRGRKPAEEAEQARGERT